MVKDIIEIVYSNKEKWCLNNVENIEMKVKIMYKEFLYNVMIRVRL